jgi:ribosomal protein S27AE
MPGYEYDNDLLREGLIRFRVKEFDRARDFFERALSVADDNNTRCLANYYLSKLTDDPIQKRQYLEETLAIDMAFAEARRDLAVLDGRLNPEEIVDPDHIPAPAGGERTAQSDRFTCPKCGGRMVFSPSGAALVCEYCQRQQVSENPQPGSEQDFFVAMANGAGFRKPVRSKTFECQGCGAGFILAPTEMSVSCAYCGSAHVIALEKERELIEPDAIIPMAFDNAQAISLINGWVDAQKPKLKGTIPSPRGIYLPVWCFDLLGNLPWNGRVVRDKQAVPVSGEYPAQFIGICVPGSYKLADLLSRIVDEYNLEGAPTYSPSYLAGWPAEVYDVVMSDAALDARKIAVDRVRMGIHHDQGEVLDLNYSPANISISSYRLILVPIWITNYSGGDKFGRVVINGQTGTVHAEIPGLGLKTWKQDNHGKGTSG